LPPAVLAASLEAVTIVRGEPDLRRKLWANVKKIRAASPILSLPIGPADKTMEISRRLWDRGLFVQGIRPPTVPEGTSRLRLTVSAPHTEEQMVKLISCLKAELPKLFQG